jgi:5-methylcytosine-specific restriction endonuclease McrA
MCFDAPPITRVTLKRRKRNRNGPDFKKLWDRQNGMCFVCGKPMTNTHDIRDSLRATFEHVVPLARGGLDNFINLALSHKRCNNERGHDMPELMKP